MLPITGVAGSDLQERLAQDNLSSPGNATRRGHKRKIDREAGRAIEMLGRAIEYLSDELALECMTGTVAKDGSAHPRIAAIELLKMLNREVYLGCPVAITFEERLQGWIRKWSTPQHAMRPALLPVARRTRW